MNSKQVIKKLEAAGWYLARVAQQRSLNEEK